MGRHLPVGEKDGCREKIERTENRTISRAFANGKLCERPKSRDTLVLFGSRSFKRRQGHGDWPPGRESDDRTGLCGSPGSRNCAAGVLEERTERGLGALRADCKGTRLCL